MSPLKHDVSGADETIRKNPDATPGASTDDVTSASSGPSLTSALVVTLVGPDSNRREWRFTPADRVWIGRGGDANILVDDPAISRRHATLIYEDGRWLYRHHGVNPSICRGKSITEAAVADQMVVSLRAGGPQLRFDAGHSEADCENHSSKPITVWMQELADGDNEAATHLWEAFFERIAGLARLRLKPSLRRLSDEEDVASSVFASLCNGIMAGRFPDLSSRDNLWQLLASMTARKVADVANREGRLKRGGGNVRGESVFLGAGSDFGFEQFVAFADSPDSEAQLVEEVNLRLDALGKSELRTVAQLRLEGYSIEEIAEQLGCNPRTVQRRLQEIRKKWSEADS